MNALSFNEKVQQLCEHILQQGGKSSKVVQTAIEISQTIKNRPLAYLGREATRVGRKKYDKLIEQLFTSTTTGIPREVFLESVLSSLAEIDQKSEADALFVLLVSRKFCP